MKSILLLLTAFITLTACAQRKSPHDTVSNGKATVTYGRPYKNEATTITFNSDVKFGGKEVKAGTYTLFAIPNEKEWTLILNGQGGQWGAYDYDKHKDKDVAKINVPVKKLDKAVEQLTISFAADNTMNIAWDKTQVAVPLNF